MICLNATDTLEAWSTTDAVIDYTVHGLVGTTFTQLAAGVLKDDPGFVIYTAPAPVSVVSVIFVNTDTSLALINFKLDPADSANPRYLIPKALSLGPAYSLHTDGPTISVMDPTGAIVYTYLAHTHDGDTLQLDGIVSDGGAFPFTTSNDVTFSKNINFAGQLGFPVTQSASADPNTLDDYEEEYYTATLTCGTSGTITVHPSYNQLAYTKVGRLVTITGNIDISAVAAPVGSLSFNLPFPVATLNQNAEGFCGGIIPVNIVAIATPGALALYGYTGSSAKIVEKTTTGFLDDVANHIQASSGLYFAFHYYTT